MNGSRPSTSRAGSKPQLPSTVISVGLGSAPFASPLAAELSEGVLDRFLRYVRIDTQAEEGSDSYPSTAKQLDLSRLLVESWCDIAFDASSQV